MKSTDGGPAELLSAEYGINGALSRLGGEGDNYLVTTPDGEQYVLKLCVEGQTSELLELEHLAIEALARDLDDVALPRTVLTRRGSVEAARTVDGIALRGRLLRFVDGTAWCEAGPATSGRRRDAGRCLARVTSALAGVEHPAARRSHRWDLTAAETQRVHVALVDDATRRRVLEQAYLLFVAGALPRLDALPHSLIHGDLNDENMLVADEHVVGLLDLGDCLYNPTICELAIALSYLLLDEPDPLEAGAEIVAAYHEQSPLSAAELEVLFPLICGRLAASVSIAAERHRTHPEREAWFVTEARAWAALERYTRIDPLTAADTLAGGTGVTVFEDRAASRENVLERRRRHLPSALSLTYREPVKFARGSRQFLFDELERPHLDLYNNVCHVGHCHPRVVEAGTRQMRRLNTNTRYLYDQLVEYGERLCALLPARLERCFVVNSGTEANELALRLARAHTGSREMLVVDGAYHGHTTTMVDLSPYKFMGPGGSGRAEDWVHVVPIPDGYRGKFKGQGRDAGVAYGDEVGRIISSLKRPLAGFITESLPSCGGQIVLPEGYLETAFNHVRAGGGICIADEVQVGFGRVGEKFWGFELQDVIPDVVVLGKPIGNGHPLAAVITTNEIAESFSSTGMEFFSTFGGNPVSCAIGTAVLDVLRDERLQENALRVGTRLREGLRGLMARHPLIGDVRGVGLFLGIELVRDRATLEPATEEAARVIDELRRRGILTGTDGPHRNVIKIKGPLVLTESDADMAVRVIDDVLSGLEAD